MKNIEKVMLEMSAYEAAIVRHALTTAITDWRHELSRKTAIQIDRALKKAGIDFLMEDEIETGEILHD